jgi:hypothetical protein
MPKKIGYAHYRKGKLYFDDIGWAMICAVAKKRKRSPTRIVIDALKRYVREHEKAKVA